MKEFDYMSPEIKKARMEHWQKVFQEQDKRIREREKQAKAEIEKRKKIQ